MSLISQFFKLVLNSQVCVLKVYKINIAIAIFFSFNSCVLTLKDEKRKQLTLFRKSANRCGSQLRTSDLDGIPSKLIVPNLLHLLMNIKSLISSSIEKMLPLSQWVHTVSDAMSTQNTRRLVSNQEK